MTTRTRIFKVAEKLSLQVLKTAVSVATATVATVCAFVSWAFLVNRTSRTGHLQISNTVGYAGKYLMLAAFVGGFYLTFKLLEPAMATRKKVLVTALGIVLPLLSFLSLNYTPTLGTAELLQKARPQAPPKPYEEAIYDVYSGLLDAERTQRSLWEKFTHPVSEGVLIRIDTTIETGRDWPKPASLQGSIIPQFDKAVSSAMTDYGQRNRESFQLQKKFNLPKYDLITTAEERAAVESCRRDQEGCREFVRKHHDYPRWVELSAVGFNEDQTVAYLYWVEWRGGFGRGGHKTLYKRNGKWHLVGPTISDDEWET